MDILTPDERIVCADHLFVALLEKGADGVFIVQEDGAIIYANARIAALLSSSVEELLSIRYPQLFSEHSAHSDVDRFEAFFRDNKGFDRYEVVMRSKGGISIPVEVLALEVVIKGVFAQCIVVRDVTEHKKMEAEIQENANRYKDIFDNANDIIFNVSSDGHLLYANRAWEEELGYTDEDMLNKTIFDIVHPDEQEKSMQLLQRIFSGESIPSVVIAFISKNKAKVFLEGDIGKRTVGSTSGSVRGIFRNITKKLINERRIRELASIVDRSFEAIVVTDLLGTIQYVNASWEQLNGWTSQEVVGKSTPRIIKSGVQDTAFYEEFWKTLLLGKSVERTVMNKRKNGSLYQAEIIVMPLIDDNGAITGFAGFQHDVTTRNQMEAQLIQQKEFSEAIIEDANAIVVILDPMGVVVGFNRKAEEVTGYTKEEILGKNLFEAIVPRVTYPAAWEKFTADRQGGTLTNNFENPILTKEGVERIISWTNSEISKDGKTDLIISFGTDITNTKKIEADLLEKNRDLERFKDLMVGRELKMIELKNELDILKKTSTAHAEKIIN